MAIQILNNHVLVKDVVDHAWKGVKAGEVAFCAVDSQLSVGDSVLFLDGYETEVIRKDDKEVYLLREIDIIAKE